MSRIKELRREVGLTQYELSEVTKIPRYKIQLIEQGIGCLSSKELVRVLKMLGLSMTTTPEWAECLIDVEADHE